MFQNFTYRNNSIKPGGGGGYSELNLQEGGLNREGALIQKEAFLRGGGLIRDEYYLSKEAESLPKKLSKS